jgi:glutamate racemase
MGGHYALLDIKSHFPQYEYETYFDHQNAPYGNKSADEIFALTEAGCLELWSKGCNLILIACNTVSAETLRRLQNKYSALPLD